MLGTFLGTVYLDHASQTNKFISLNNIEKGNILKRIGYTSNVDVPKTTWRIKGLKKWVHESISMFILILDKDDNSIVDEGLVGILDAYNTGCNTPSSRYNQVLET